MPLSCLDGNKKKSAEQTCKAVERMEKYDNGAKRSRCRMPHFEKKIREAEELEKRAETCLKQARENQEAVRSAKDEISHVYHP